MALRLCIVIGLDQARSLTLVGDLARLVSELARVLSLMEAVIIIYGLVI